MKPSGICCNSDRVPVRTIIIIGITQHSLCINCKTTPGSNGMRRCNGDCVATQRSDGSWPTDSVWGGYGGTVYTTSMADLCLESYYRHAIRENQTRIAERK